MTVNNDFFPLKALLSYELMLLNSYNNCHLPSGSGDILLGLPFPEDNKSSTINDFSKIGSHSKKSEA